METLFPGEEKITPSKKKGGAKKTVKQKDGRALYVHFTIEEIMEFFDWGLVFPNAYLPLLLTPNDYKSRFRVDTTNFILPLSTQLSDAHNYYLEFDASEIDEFTQTQEGIEYTIYPIPAHFVKRIVCDSAKSKAELERLWPMTDIDEIESVLGSFEKVEENIPTIDIPQEKINDILSFIQHFDKCLGAICFTKDLDPFIKSHFEDVEDFSDLTYSRYFLSLVRSWMPEKSRKIFDGILPADTENEKRYIGFIEKMIAKDWDNNSTGTYLKALSIYNQPVDKIIGEITDDSEASQKIVKVLREIELGISSLETALEDESLKNPYRLFLLLLKLFYRKGRLETDARSFRQNLFEKDYITNPKHISNLGAFYGYYTGYHHFQRFETIKSLGDLDISSDKELLNIFRLRLSPLDNFEKEVMNLVYNKVSATYTGFPRWKLNFKKEKGTGKEMAREKYSFIPVPQLGQFAYRFTTGAAQKNATEQLINIIKRLQLLDAGVVAKQLETHLQQAKNRPQLEKNLKAIVDLLERLNDKSPG